MLGLAVDDSYTQRRRLSMLAWAIHDEILGDDEPLRVPFLGPLAEALGVAIVVWAQDPHPGGLRVLRDLEVRQTQGTSHPSRVMTGLFVAFHSAF